MISKRAQEYYQINFTSEIADLCKPKVLCSICRARLSKLETGKLTIEKREKDRPNVEFLPRVVDNICITRSTLGCNSENRCQICQINASSLSNFMVKYKNQAPRTGRPFGYEGRESVHGSLSVEAVRDIQRLGYLGLGKHSYRELGRILRREGITFPTGGIKGA